MTQTQTTIQNNSTRTISNYGGIIELEDFSTFSPNRRRISNQADATNLPEFLSKQKEKINEEKKYKNMTLEELREMKIISNTNRRPSSNLTNEKWQKEFNARKLFITPYDKSVTKLKCKYARESGMWNKETMGEYDGATNWQEYCSFINDVLNNIRSGQVDYCYYIFQITDLLKFHLDDLRTMYCDGYWMVWLER